MLVEQLAVAYKFHSCIGNSIDLKVMIHEVLRTFVSESYAAYGEFCIKHGEKYEKFDSFGKIGNFKASSYKEYKKSLQIIEKDKLTILKINLDKGVIFLANTDDSCKDCSFFYSLYESLIPKLNLSVNTCLNYQELEQSHELLIKQKKELEKANKTKDDFLANMSHELKTPLNSIIVISTLMSKNKSLDLSEKQLKNIKIIKKSADDLLDLINDILDISKIEAGELSVHKEKLDFEELIEELYDSFLPVCKQKEISFNKELIGENFFVYTDVKRLKQIIKNLLSNAIKFTNDGGVTFKLYELDQSFRIEVIDTGIGIEKDHLKHIFDRFKQVDNSRTRKYSGTGLGLTISNELTTMLGGKLHVESTVEKGSKFYFEIPRGEVSSHDEHHFEKTNEKSMSCIINYDIEEFKPKKSVILRVADDLEQFKLTVSLKKAGYNIIPLNNVSKLDEIIENLNGNNFIFILEKEYALSEEVLSKLQNYKNSFEFLTNIQTKKDFKMTFIEKFKSEDLINTLNSLENKEYK